MCSKTSFIVRFRDVKNNLLVNQSLKSSESRIWDFTVKAFMKKVHFRRLLAANALAIIRDRL